MKGWVVDLDAVCPIYPGHCPLHLASSLQRPFLPEIHTLQHGQFSLQVLPIPNSCCFAHSGSSSTCWKGWPGRVDPPRQAESCWLLWMHVCHSLHGRREH